MDTDAQTPCPHCGKYPTDTVNSKHLENPDKYYGIAIRQIRLEHNKTQEDFANILSVDVSKIIDMENGVRRPELEQQDVLTNMLGIHPTSFAGRALFIKNNA